MRFETNLLKCKLHEKFQGNRWCSRKWAWRSEGDSLLSSCSRTTSCKFLVDSRLICQFKKWHSSEKNLLLSHGSNFVQDDEFLIMHDLFEPKNQDFPHEAYTKINLEELADSESLAEFRYRKGTFSRLQKFRTLRKPYDATKDRFVVE